MEPNNYEFTAIRGVQAGRAYYVAMCPLQLVPRLLRFDEDDVPAELRAQRVLNRTRVPAIARYIAQNSTEYILSSLCASVDGAMDFEPVSQDGPLRTVGKLRISMTARILINDGQHRRAAIEEAVRERPALGDETISIVLFADQGLGRAQQMFADLNVHAVRPSRSIGVLYNHRDAMARVARSIVTNVSFFRDQTEFEKTTISNRSIKLFTLSSIYQATAELLGQKESASIRKEDERTAIEFWSEVGKNIPDWSRAARRDISAAELRRDYIHAHGVGLHAIAMAGAQLLSLHPNDWRSRLKKLRGIDWGRTNVGLWEGRALVGGRLSKTRNNVLLVSNIILQQLGLPLTAEGERVELLHARPTAYA